MLVSAMLCCVVPKLYILVTVESNTGKGEENVV